MKAMARQQRSHSIEFKRQVAREFVAGETLYGLAKRYDLSRQLIRVWVEKYESGALDDDAQAADLLKDYEAKIVALERMVGRQALEIEFLKGALKNAARPSGGVHDAIPHHRSKQMKRKSNTREVLRKVRQLPRGKALPNYRGGRGWLIVSPSGKAFHASHLFTDTLSATVPNSARCCSAFRNTGGDHRSGAFGRLSDAILHQLGANRWIPF
jgi:transposase-like protein